MKTMLAQLTPTTTKAFDAMTELGLITEDGSNQFYDAEGNLRGMYDIVGLLNGATKDLTEEQRKQYLQTIFGNDAMRSAGALAGMTADEYEAMYMVVNESTS
jgi:TP901 family phage tail tape measure protein